MAENTVATPFEEEVLAELGKNPFPGHEEQLLSMLAVKDDAELREILKALTPEADRKHPAVPKGFKLEIPDRFKDDFLFPLQQLTKMPTEIGWQNRADSYRYRIPRAATGYGIPTGKNGYFFLDLDRKTVATDGFASWQKILDEHHGGEPVETYELQTASGAKQIWFTITPETQELMKPGVGSKSTGIAPGIDHRVNTSYSVGPGSVIYYPEKDRFGYYKELTPDRDFLALEDFPWLVEILASRQATGGFKRTTNAELMKLSDYEKDKQTIANGNVPAKWKTPSFHGYDGESYAGARKPSSPASKAASSRASKSESVSALDLPNTPAESPWHNQKGNKAIEPAIGWLLWKAEEEGKRFPQIFPAGRKAGYAGADRASFLEAAETVFSQLQKREDSLWFNYDADQNKPGFILENLAKGWEEGNAAYKEKKDLEKAYRFDHLADRFREEHPEYRWVAPRGVVDGGAWYRYDTDEASSSYGTYAPINEDIFAEGIIAWLRADEAAAAADGDSKLADQISKVISSPIPDRAIRHLKGTAAVRVELDRFDSSANEIVDKSGIRNLDTMEVRAPTPEFFATRKIELAGSADLYEKHRDTVERIMSSVHPKDRALLDAFLGTVLRQQQPLSKTGIIAWGPTKDNGKTSLVESLFGVLGDGGASTSSFGLKAAHATLYKQGGNTYAEADLDNTTCTIFDDFGAMQDVDYEKLKQLIGSGQGYKARQIREKTRSIRLNHTVFITCNRLPNFGRGEDVVDRFQIIKFPYKYPRDEDFDPKNKWHRRRDPHFTNEVRTNPEVREAFYYYLLIQHKAWAESMGRIETSAISSHVRGLHEEWRGKTNTLQAILKEFAARDAHYFVSERDLLGFLSAKLREQGQGVLGQQSLKTELEMLTLFKEWGVVRYEKTARGRSKKLKDLNQSMWRADDDTPAVTAAQSANIYVGIRLKTDSIGKFLNEDEWDALVEAIKKAEKQKKADNTEAKRIFEEEGLMDEDRLTSTTIMAHEDEDEDIFG